MKPPILLKLLQQISQKTSTRDSNSDVGFTIIEVLVVVLIIGILSAIAGPGWLAFISRQRTRTVNDAVFRALKSAQSAAKLNKQNVTVQFDVDASVPIVTTDGVSERLNANGEIKDGMVDLVVAACNATDPTTGDCTGYDFDDADTDYPITFDSLGAVADENENTWLAGASPKTLPYIVTVSTADGNLKRCVIVETLLGSMRIAEGDSCPVPTN